MFQLINKIGHFLIIYSLILVAQPRISWALHRLCGHHTQTFLNLKSQFLSHSSVFPYSFIFKSSSTCENDSINKLVTNESIRETPQERYKTILNELNEKVDDNDDLPAFISKLKTLASKRIIMSNLEKEMLLDSVLTKMNSFNPDQFSDCIWSLGTLHCSISNRLDISNSGDMELIDSHTNNAYSSSKSESRREKVMSYFADISNGIESFDAIYLIKLFNGLCKMGFTWEDIPNPSKLHYLELINQSSSNNMFSREIASYVYSIGQLRATKDDLDNLSPGFITSMVNNLFDELLLQDLRPQGACNALNGLSNMHISLEDITSISPPNRNYQKDLFELLAKLVPIMKPQEFSSQLHSLAVIKASWNIFPDAYKQSVLDMLEKLSDEYEYSTRELSNVLWSAGKINIPLAHDSNDRLFTKLIHRLTVKINEFTDFDVESAMVGLGLLKVNQDSLSSEFKRAMISRISSSLSNMNIFCVYNVLWGLARMDFDIKAMNIISQQQNNTTYYKRNESTSFSYSLLDKTISILHTFLLPQYGDVFYSLGSMGYHVNTMSEHMKDRCLAISSRVFLKLDVRAAAYTLWGLSKMGFTWSDFSRPARSLVGGREAAPLAGVVSRYLRQRVSSMREHEYAVLLYSLGQLRVDWNDLHRANVSEKLHHRATRVSSHLTSRSVCNALAGLSASGVKWSELPVQTQEAWQEALVGCVPVFNKDNVAGGRRGLKYMNNKEVLQTIHALAVMNVKWKSDLTEVMKACVVDVLSRNQLLAAGDLEQLDAKSCLGDLTRMQCNWNELSLPENFHIAKLTFGDN